MAIGLIDGPNPPVQRTGVIITWSDLKIRRLLSEYLCSHGSFCKPVGHTLIIHIKYAILQWTMGSSWQISG